MACISCLSSKSLRGRARSESIEPEVKQLPERCDRSVRKKPDTGVKISSPVPSTHSGSSVGRSCESCDYDFATFASTVQVARLPVVVFDDEVCGSKRKMRFSNRPDAVRSKREPWKTKKAVQMLQTRLNEGWASNPLYLTRANPPPRPSPGPRTRRSRSS